MKITVIAGTGAMGLIFGARLAQAGNDVSLLDVNKEAIAAVNNNGAKSQTKREFHGKKNVVRDSVFQLYDTLRERCVAQQDSEIQMWSRGRDLSSFKENSNHE